MVCENCGDKLGDGRKAYKHFPRHDGRIDRFAIAEIYCKPCLEYIRDMESPKRGRLLRISCKFNPNPIEVN